MAPGAAKQRSNLLEALVEGAEFERLFAAIRGGVHLDLDSPDGRRLMWLYVMTRLRARDMYRESSIAKFIEEIASFFKIYNVPDKPRWRSVQVIRASGSANLSLRLMARDEAPFRGCLGSDCSTGTRLERALEPAHLNFAIEEEPHKPIGQIEIVLGESEDGKKALAFLERVQSGSNLRTGELMGLVAGLHDVLRENGFTLVALSSLNDYSRLGHPISNFEIIQSRLKEALDNGFDQGQIHRGFRRYRDQFLVKDTKPYNLVADRVGVQGVDVRELHPLPPISKYHLVTNAFPLERIDPQPLNELLQLRLRGWASSASDKVAPQVIREVTERLFPTDCESALSRAG